MAINETNINYIQDGENAVEQVLNRPTKDLVVEVNNNLEERMPAGGIIMWSGSIANIPAGWALCDGNNGTPNLQDRFVVGAGNSYSVGSAGGSKDAVVVSHNHSGSTTTDGDHGHSGSSTTTDGSHRHYSGVVVRTSDSDQVGAYASEGYNNSTSRREAASSVHTNNSNPYKKSWTSTTGNHNHSLNIINDGNHNHSLNINSEGESGTDKNLPPYYALAFIMKL